MGIKKLFEDVFPNIRDCVGNIILTIGAVLSFLIILTLFNLVNGEDDLSVMAAVITAMLTLIIAVANFALAYYGFKAYTNIVKDKMFDDAKLFVTNVSELNIKINEALQEFRVRLFNRVKGESEIKISDFVSENIEQAERIIESIYAQFTVMEIVYSIDLKIQREELTDLVNFLIAFKNVIRKIDSNNRAEIYFRNTIQILDKDNYKALITSALDLSSLLTESEKENVKSPRSQKEETLLLNQCESIFLSKLILAISEESKALPYETVFSKNILVNKDLKLKEVINNFQQFAKRQLFKRN